MWGGETEVKKDERVGWGKSEAVEPISIECEKKEAERRISVRKSQILRLKSETKDMLVFQSPAQDLDILWLCFCVCFF